jgi:inner membrane protein
MDSVTHIFLGGAIGQLVAGGRAGYGRTFLLGALAATVPDFDVFIHTGNVMRDHALHRHFMHSFVLVPVLAALAAVPFVLQKQARPWAARLYLAAVLACLSHTLLDSLTSFGTMFLWPFTDRRYSFDLIAVVDPAFTVPLIVGTMLALRRRRPGPAALAAAVAIAYLGLAWVQHGRAAAVQRQLLAARQVAAPRNPRVLPQIGAVLGYRSIYIDNGRIYADAIRVPFFGAPGVKAGGSVEVVDATDLRPFPPPADMLRDFDRFVWFSDGFVARMPGKPLVISDLRYTLTPEGTASIWGLQVEETPAPVWRTPVSMGSGRRLVGDLFRPQGYVPVADVAGAAAP